MRIVTSGRAFLDIDAYACMIAYAELLNKINTPAIAVSTAPFNDSISKSVLEWGATIKTNYVPELINTYSIVDVSDPDHFETFVTIDQIYEIIDHHPGSKS